MESMPWNSYPRALSIFKLCLVLIYPLRHLPVLEAAASATYYVVGVAAADAFADIASLAFDASLLLILVLLLLLRTASACITLPASAHC
jgi:hypothetical protein